MNFDLNGQAMVQLKGHRFSRLDVVAGDYKLSASFCSYLTNKKAPQTIDLKVTEGQLTIVGVAVGLPENWKWWRLGSKENWRDQIYMTVAPDSAGEDTLRWLSTFPMVVLNK